MNSIWLETFKYNKTFEKLNQNISCDVCIIGAGIFGLTCAYYLTKQGFNVAVLDRDDIGTKATGHTTAKITSQHGLIYKHLIDDYGLHFAKSYLYANQKAIDNIKEIIDTENISCDFNFENHCVYTTNAKDLKSIQDEINAVNSLDFNCEFVTKTGLPFDILGGICFKNQAQFHPYKYLCGLCNSIKKKKKIFTHTTICNVKNNGSFYTSYSDNNYKIESKFVIMASHYPFINIPGFYFSKMYQSTSYLIAIETNKTLFKGMYLSASDPIFSFRTAKFVNKNFLLIGGANHKTGESHDFSTTYGVLENIAKKYYPDCKILYHWNTRDCITLDKIPYIGLYSSNLPNFYIGTGFNKWGMTSSNVAGNIIVDMINGKENPYSFVFDSTRIKPIKNADEFKNVIVQSSKSLILDKIKRSDLQLDNIAPNSGGIIEVNGQKVGIYKSQDNKFFAVNPICTHLGCLLSWNNIDKTWDCPCHGSRFDYTGKSLYDPSFKDLEVFNI